MTTLDDLYDELDRLQTAIDDAAETDDEDVWGNACDDLEGVQDEIDRIERETGQ